MQLNNSSFQRNLLALPIFAVVLFNMLSPLRAQTLTTLVNFNGTNGGSPGFGRLLQGQDGNLYGTTQSGGANAAGTVFSVTPGGSLTTIYSFCSKSNCSDGDVPEGALIQSSDGTFYGTTTLGGAAPTTGHGTAFKFSSNSPLSTIYTFCAESSPCSDGGSPVSGVIQGSDGNFYGTATTGVLNGGVAYKISSAGALSVLYSFCSQGVPCIDGSNPTPGLIQGSDGNFYGLTSDGGAHATTTFPATGTIFKLSPGGNLTTLYNFCLQPPFCADGASPIGSLILASEGNFYGTTYLGGATIAGGTIFKLTPGGVFITIHSFCSASNCADGSGPHGGLLEASDGNLYGTTAGGGSNSQGTLFKITKGGAFTTLYNFCSQSGCTDGAYPLAGVIQGADGNIYGTTAGPVATTNAGTVFKFGLGAQAAPSITSNGIVPVFSSATTIEPGEWCSIYGSNLASGNTSWNGNFPTSLGNTTVTVNGKNAYLWFVSPTQINFQAPDDTATGTVPVVLTTPAGSVTSTVTLGPYGPSFSMLNGKYPAAIVLTPGSPGNTGAGYDIIGPVGAFSYPTRPVKAGETLILYGVGFGPTMPNVLAGQLFSGSAPSVTLPQITIGGVTAQVQYGGIIEAGLFQFNVLVPAAGGGDQVLSAQIGGVTTPANVSITIQ